MRIYLDIDGTLIHSELSDRDGTPADGLEEFLIALRPFETYWLTTHCRDGNPTRAREILKRLLPTELHGDIDRIQPTTWDTLKTEGIDWGSDFVWFDDSISEAERARFMNAPITQSFIEIDLRTNPTQLIELTRDLIPELTECRIIK